MWKLVTKTLRREPLVIINAALGAKAAHHHSEQP